MPIGIMTDFSLAIINAAISEYNNETFKQYIERTYKIMVGEAPRQDLEKLFVFTCTAHVMKNVKRNAGKSKDIPWQSSKQHIAMRFFGRLIHSSSLEEATNLVRTAYIVFHSEYVTDSVDTALKELEEAINTFSPDIKSCIEEVQEESSNDTRNTESPLTYDSNVPSAQAEMLRAKDTEIVRYWKAMLQPLERHKKSMDTTLPKNKYHNPEFMDYCVPYLLPSIALWSRILDGEFAKFSNDYRDFSIDRASSTTGHVERHFGLLKQNKVKPSLDKFIMRMWESKRGTKRIFADGLVRGKKRESTKQQKAFLKSVKLLEEDERMSPSRPESDEEDVPLPEESWSKPSTPRSMPQKSRVGRYQQPPFKPIHFSPKVKVETDGLERPKLDSHKTYDKASASEPKGASSKHKRVTNTSNSLNQSQSKKPTRKRPSNAFKNFKKSVWPEITMSCTSSLAQCDEKLLEMWGQMDDNERLLYDTINNENCVCGKDKEAFWVGCDLCDKWYHTDCAKIGEAIADDMAYFHCMQCIEALFRPSMNYLSFLSTSLGDEGNQLHSASSVNAACQSLATKSGSVINNVGKSSYPFFEHSHVPFQAHPGRGIENTFNNCWLNALLQILFGTSMFQHLFAPTEKKDLPLVSLARDISQQLKESSSQPVKTKGLIDEVARKLGSNPEKREHLDVGDGFTLMLEKLCIDANGKIEQNLSAATDSQLLKVTVLNRCGRCRQVSGHIEKDSSVKLQILESKEDAAYSLQDLLWNSMACSYEYSPDVSCNGCQTKASSSKQPSCRSFLHPRAVLPITLQRVFAGTERPVKTRIDIPVDMDLSRLVGGCNTAAGMTYSLYAWVVWFGRKVSSGHCVSYIRDATNTVRFVDDEKVKKLNLGRTLNDREIQKGVKMLFYVREDCTRPAAIEDDVFDVLPEAKEDFLNLINGDTEKALGFIKADDIASVMAGDMLNSTVIDAFFSKASDEATAATKRSVQCLNSYFFSQLQKGEIDSKPVLRVLRQENLDKNDIIIMPIYQDTTIGHHAVMAIYPKISLMVYCDSLRPGVVDGTVTKIFMLCLSLMRSFSPNKSLARFIDTWTLVSSSQIEKQHDAISCGVYCCLNGYRFMICNRMMSANDIKVLEKVRFWISTKARMAHTRSTGKQVSNPKIFELINNKLVKLVIHSEIPNSFLIMLLGKVEAHELRGRHILEQINEALSSYIDHFHY